MTTKTGRKDFDELPPKMGAKDVDDLRLRLKRLELAKADIIAKLNLCVKNYALVKAIHPKPAPKKCGSLEIQ